MNKKANQRLLQWGPPNSPAATNRTPMPGGYHGQRSGQHIASSRQWRMYNYTAFARICSTLCFLLLGVSVKATVYTVTTVADAGAGSLRDAITTANSVGAGAGPHSIVFSVSGTINLAAALPSVTKAGVTVDGAGQSIIISSNVNDVDRDCFTIGGDNVALKNVILQNTGGEGVYVNGIRTGVTIENVTIRNTKNDWINHGIYMNNKSTNMVIRNVTMTDIQDGYWGIRFINTVTNLMVDGFTIKSGTGATGRGIQFQGAVTGATIKNSVIDLDDPATTNDGDYGVYFNSTATNLTIDSTQFHDCEVYPLFITGAANNIHIRNSTFDNFDGWSATQMIRFNSTATRVYMDNITLNGDLKNTTNDADYGIVFVSHAQRVLIKNSTFNEVDIRTIQFSQTNNDSVIIDNNKFTNNGTGGGYGTIEFYYMWNTTSDVYPVVISNNTFIGTNGIPIYLRPGNGGNYNVKDVTIKNNTITGTKSRLGAIQLNYIDNVQVTQNSIYNIQGIALELAGAANCGYEGTNKPQLLSSAATGANTYNLQVKMPAVCGSGNCSIEVFSTEAGMRGTGGQHYVTTLTGLPSGISTRSVTGAFPEMTTFPYGTFTATMKVTLATNKCGTSEYSNKIGIRPIGPAGVDQGIITWVNPDVLEDGNMVQNEGWEDFSGQARNFDKIAGDPARVEGGINSNHYANFDGNDYLYPGTPGFAKTMPAGEVIVVTKTNSITSNNGSPYDFGGNSNFHYTWNNGYLYNDFGTNDRFGWQATTKAIIDPHPGTTVTGSPIDVRKWNIFGTYAGPGKWGVDFNGGQQTVQTASNTINFTLGAGREYVGATHGYPYIGDIAEEALWNRVLTAKERQRVNSYYAIKYGLTLNQNYIASDSTTIWWNITTNAGYNKLIAGIARDKRAVLHQKQSRSTTANDVVTIGVGNTFFPTFEDHGGNIANDKSAFVWGTDSASINFSVAYATPYSDYRMARRWKVQKTNWNDTTIVIKLLKGNKNRTLIVSADPTFATGVTNFPLNDTGAVALNSSNIPNGSYFSFANIITAPGCVTLGIQAWYRADASGAANNIWPDFSGYDRDALQATVASQPILTSNTMNYQPAFDFDNSNDFFDITNNLGIAGTNKFSVFSVGLRQGTGDVDMILAHNTLANYGFFVSGESNFKSRVGYNGVASFYNNTANYTLNTPFMQGLVRTANNSFTHYLNNSADGTGGIVGMTAAGLLSTNLRIGYRQDHPFNGYLNEVIVYNRDLSTTEIQKVNSYLALKYGITMNQTSPTDYLASNGTTMWNAADNTGYTTDIFGIGRDNCDNLYQKQSRSVNTGSQFAMSVGESIYESNAANPNEIGNNISFLTTAHNNGAMTFVTGVAGDNATTRMARVWKVDKTNWADTLITLKYFGSITNSYLLINNSSAAFATIDQELTINDDSTVSFNTNILPDGAYFTIGKAIHGPANVNAGVQMWLRADDGSASGTVWEDYSGNDKDVAPTTVAKTPVVAANSMNFNPAISFDGTDDDMRYSARLFPNTSGFHMFAVSADFRTTFTEARCALGLGGTSGDFPSMDFTTSGALSGYNPGMGLSTPTSVTIAATILPLVNGKTNISTLSSTNLSTATTDNVVAGMNGITTNTTLDAKQQTEIGNGVWVGSSTNNFWKGLIPEIAVYNRQLAAFEQQKINSYLALKYGLTIDSGRTNYVASDWDGTAGTTIWDATVNIGYRNNIAGIGRDVFGGLYQKQSRSVGAGNILTIYNGNAAATDNISNTSDIDDLSFLAWSDNNGGTDFTAPVVGVSNVDARMARVWKMQKTNWSDGDITVKVDKSGDRYLLVSPTDPAFGAATTTAYPLSTATGSVTINSSEIPDGAFFTIATRIVGPGCVNNGIRMWVRADYNASGSTWTDFSGNQKNLVQATVSKQPTLVTNGINYNAAMSFDGGDDMRFASRLYADTSGFHLFAVSNDKRTVFTQLRAPLGIGTTTGDNPNMDFQTDATSLSGFNPTMAGSSPTEWGTAITNLPLVNGKVNISSLSSTNLSTGATDNIVAGMNGITTNTTLDAKRQTEIGNGVFVGSSLDAFWLGTIPEVAIYNRQLTAAEAQRVNSYFALKYGVTLDSGRTDYLASDGVTKMWSATTNTGYGVRITGIGRDDCDDLNLKQSVSQDAGMITLSLGSIASTQDSNLSVIGNDNSYLVFGDNNGDSTFTAEVEAPVSNQRLGRIWKVQKTNWSDDNITLKINKKVNNTYLLISTDPSFATVDQEYGISADDSTVAINTMDIPDGAYFTLGKQFHGPANVNTRIKVWLDANDQITTDGTTVSWNDKSGNEIVVSQATAARQPVMAAVDSTHNYNSAVSFDGGDVLVTNQQILRNAMSSGSVYLAAKYKDLTGYDSPVDFDDNDPHLGRKAGNPGAYMNNSTPVEYFPTALSLTVNQNQFSGFIWGGGTNGGLEVRKDGAGASDPTMDFTSVGFTQNFGVGATSAAAEGINGTISEVFVYDRKLTAIEKNKVESYLGLKYGITLSQSTPTNYVASDWDGTSGVIMWNAATAGIYKNHIAGIGRDDNGGLLQKQSRSVDTSGNGNIVAIGLTSIDSTSAANTTAIADDMSFMVWADDGVSGVKTTEYPSSLNPGGCSKVTRVAREWKVQKTGTFEAAQVKFYVNKFVNSSTAIGDLKLLINSSDDFTGANVSIVSATGYDVTKKIATFDQVSFADGDYFTLVTNVTNEAPGGVSTNLYTWHRADKGVDNSATIVLADQSASAIDVSQATVAAKPAYNSALINFNPTLSFDGGDVVTNGAVTVNQSATSGEEIFTVVMPNSAAGNRNVVGLGNATSLQGTELRFNVNVLEYASKAAGTAQSIKNGTTVTNGRIQLAGANRAATGAANLMLDGDTVASGTIAQVPVNTGFNIGARKSAATNDQNLNGQVAEVVIYNRQLTATERSKVMSYLAIKYGITLSSDYLYPDSTLIWTKANNIGFLNNVTGIGRDDCNGLQQKQSKSVNTNAMVTIGSGTGISASNALNTNDLNNGSAVVFGDDNGSIASWTSATSPLNRKRLTRKWKLQLTGAGPDVTLQVPANASIASAKLPAEQNATAYLLVDNDGDFSTGATEVPMTLNGTNWEATFTPADGDYFTFATDNECATATAKLASYGGTASAGNDKCYVNGWILFRDNASPQNYLAGIYDPSQLIDVSKISATVNVTTPVASLGSGSSTGITRLMRRMLQIDCNDCYDAVSNPAPGFKVRMFYAPDEQAAANTGASGAVTETSSMVDLKLLHSITDDPIFHWFKAEGSVATVLSRLTPTGINLTGANWGEGGLDTGTIDDVKYVDFSPVEHFSTFGGYYSAALNIPLSLKLTDFTARKTNDSRVQLNWATGMEKDADYFEVQRSAESSRFENVVATMKAAGNSSTRFEYQTYDREPLNGINYYRLKMVGKDGSVAYSAVRTVDINSIDASILVYPTDNRDGLVKVVLPDGYEQAELHIVNAMGQSIPVRIDGEGLKRQLTLKGLPYGQYLISVINKGVRHNFKVAYRP